MTDRSASQPVDVELRVLVLPPTERDADAMRKLLADARIDSLMCSSIAMLGSEMLIGVGAVLISEEALMEDSEGLENYLGVQPVWSDLPLIVLSRSGIESPKLTAAFPRLGNISVLERPVRVTTFLSLVQSALRARKRQYQVRAHLIARELNERNLKESEARLTLAVETGKLGVWEFDLQAQTIASSRGCRAHFGRTDNDAFNYSDFLEAIHPEDISSVVEAVAKAVKDDVEYDVEYRVIWPDGSTHWLLGRGRPAHDALGVPVSVVGVTLDITERKTADEQRSKLLEAERAARAEAERAGRMKDEFLATISHELRTPLNAILGWVQLIKKRSKTNEFSEGIDVIERNARAQTRIIEDLLDMSRIISGKINLEIQTIDLAAVIKAAIETVKPTADTKNISIESKIDESDVEVSGDSNRLHQVFWNLLTNAVKFTPKGGHVVVEVAKAESWIEIRVRDSGEGIAPAFVPFVFDRFSQADATTTRRHGGLGLGLAIVKQLIETHGGRVAVSSEGIGKGATFAVTLPLRAVHMTPTKQITADSKLSKSGVVSLELAKKIAGLKVLVVDDEPDARSLLRTLLEDCGAIVYTAGSSDEAYAIVTAKRPDVIVSDVGMPDKDGYSLVRQIRALAHSDGGNTPAIALTAYAREEDRNSAIAAGFQQHLTKPLEPSALISAVASAALRN